jgi:hypothetical protein
MSTPVPRIDRAKPRHILNVGPTNLIFLTNELVFCSNLHNFFRIPPFENVAMSWPDIE